MKHEIIIYLGPSLSHRNARRILEADYRPAAAHGDVISSVYHDQPSVIALIDIEQGETLTVWHKEILDALNQGVAVYGAGGVGALRAAELADFGMQGKGWVYENFKTGRLECDDEVLRVCHGNDGSSWSQSLVNMRATLARAVRDGVIEHGDAVACIEAAHGVYYPERTWQAVFQRVAETKKLPGTCIEDLKVYVRQHGLNIQKEDAILLLKTIRDEYASGRIQTKKRQKSDGKLFSVLYDRHRKVSANGTKIPSYIIANYFGMRGPDSREISESALNKQLVLLLADQFRVRVSEGDVREETARFRNRNDLTTNRAYCRWLDENDMTEEDFVRLMNVEARVRRLRRYLIWCLYMERTTRFVLDELRLQNQYSHWKQRAADAQSLLEEKRSEVLETINQGDYHQLLTDFFSSRNLPETLDLPDVAQEMGFNFDEFFHELAKDKVSRESIKSFVTDLFFLDQHSTEMRTDN